MRIYNTGFDSVEIVVADPDPGSSVFLTPGSRIHDGKKSRLGIRAKHPGWPDHFSDSIVTIFWVKNI
jgi:hypothetical protein